MELLPLALVQSSRLTQGIASSALPGAPVVTGAVRRPVATRSRTTLAHLLERAAVAVAPKPTCTPAA